MSISRAKRLSTQPVTHRNKCLADVSLFVLVGSRFAPGKEEKTLLAEKGVCLDSEADLEAFGQIKNINKQDFMIQVLRNVAMYLFVFPNFSKERNTVIFKE